MKKLILGLGALALLATTGCQHSMKFESSPEFEAYSQEVNEWTGSEKLGIYVADRFHDLMDIAQFDLAVGDGFLLNAHATKFLQVGGGYMNNGLRWGHLKRGWGAWSDDRVEGGIACGFNLYWEDVERQAVWGTPGLFTNDYAYEGPDYLDSHGRNWSDIGAHAHLFWIGLNANVSPFEAVDFVTGIFGLPNIYLTPLSPGMDLGDDDTRARLRAKYDLPYYEYTLEHWSEYQ